MFQTILSTLIGIPTGYITTEIINSSYNILYNKNISTYLKYNIITIIIFVSFLTGYTSNDLMKNIEKNIEKYDNFTLTHLYI
jgi:hypothetical protein